jgi:hypothetical protein
VSLTIHRGRTCDAPTHLRVDPAFPPARSL